MTEPNGLQPARCSFCRKGQADVNALIAGMGVYICNECVAVANDSLAQLGTVNQKVTFDPAKHFRGFETDKLLKGVALIEPVHQDVSAQQALMVAILRERAVSWAEIGQALGVSRQAAWRRFATEPEGE
jgi:hypothetical protein